MKKVTIVLFCALLLIACEEKEIKLYPSIKNTATLLIDQQGNFEKNAIISSTEIRNSIDDVDFDESGAIENITTENITLIVKRLSGNTAESAKLDLTIEVNNEGAKNILDDFVFTIHANETQIDISKSLKAEGVKELTDQLKNIIIGSNSSNDIEFKVVGSSTPVDSKVNIELQVIVQNGLVIKQTIDGI